jgi:hypothetical protein
MTTEQDRGYVRAEGVALVSGMWGEESDPTKARQVNDRDSFALLWDETASVWVVIFRMCVNVGTLCVKISLLSERYSCRAFGSILVVFYA